MSADLVLVHLYPDLLRTYGDRGNILTLQRRAEWRGFSVDVVWVSRGERLPASPNLILIGGGTDRVQEVIAPDLKERRGELEEVIAAGTVLLGVCGGYQFLGKTYVAADGTQIDGLGFLDITTRAGRDRIIGRVRARASLWGEEFDLSGSRTTEAEPCSGRVASRSRRSSWAEGTTARIGPRARCRGRWSARTSTVRCCRRTRGWRTFFWSGRWRR